MFRRTLWCMQSLAAQSGKGSAAYAGGQMNARYGSGGYMKLSPGRLTVQLRSKIQQDRREHSLTEIDDWDAFCEDACSIPTKAGPMWVGADDPRVVKYMARKEKMKTKVAQIARPILRGDPVKDLENHQFKAYFTSASNLMDPLSVADGLYRTGRIKQHDIKHTATQIKYAARPPVVTIMGHVDHGKTTLLDTLRKTNVAAGEAGGITQSIGAFRVKVPGSEQETVTFIDTPGHESFTEMRKSGANTADFIVLVISVTDGIQQQTVEVLELAKEKGIPLIIACNKMDRGTDAQKKELMTNLAGHGVELEANGGDTLFIPISAKAGTNLDQLLEYITLQAAMSELHTPQPSRAEVNIIESKERRVHGIVRCGVLKKGAWLVCGIAYCKVNAIFDDYGREIESAGPSSPVAIEGFTVLPKPGNVVLEVAGKQYANNFVNLMRDVWHAEGGREAYMQYVSADAEGQFYNRKPVNRIRAYDRTQFNLTVKAGTFGQLQALLRLIYALPELPGTQLSIVSTEIGNYNDNDIHLLNAKQQPGAIILFGDVKDETHVTLPDYLSCTQQDIVFHAVDWLKKKIAALIPRNRKDIVHTRAVCKSLFRASASAGGNAGGMLVEEGLLNMKTSHNMRLVRQAKTVWEGKMKELRRFKDTVMVVEKGLECGVVLDGSVQFQVGDVLEEYSVDFEEHDVEKLYEDAKNAEEEQRRHEAHEAEMKARLDELNSQGEKGFIE